MQDKTGADGDTVKLLRECDAGIKMGISAIDDVIDDVKNGQFRQLLHDSKNQHEKLKQEIVELLDEHHDDGKDPNPMAKGMSKIKTNMKMAMANALMPKHLSMKNWANMAPGTPVQFLI